MCAGLKDAGGSTCMYGMYGLTQIGRIRAVAVEEVRDRQRSSGGGRVDPQAGDFTAGRDAPL
jgi:hypothetical protein